MQLGPDHQGGSICAPLVPALGRSRRVEEEVGRGCHCANRGSNERERSSPRPSLERTFPFGGETGRCALLCEAWASSVGATRKGGAGLGLQLWQGNEQGA